jgi:hypothetical protein
MKNKEWQQDCGTYWKGMQAYLSRWHKSIEKDGDYVDKGL